MVRLNKRPASAAGTRSPPPVPPAVAKLYDQHPREISILLGWFFLRHLHQLYRRFKGDMVSAMVLGEIAHHNICHYFSSGKTKGPEGPWTNLEPCNPYSLSVATGLPRETCRRKVQTLVRQGLIRPHPAGGYVIPPNLGTHFRETNQRTLTDVVTLIGNLEDLLGPSLRESAKLKGRRA